MFSPRSKDTILSERFDAFDAGAIPTPHFTRTSSGSPLTARCFVGKIGKIHDQRRHAAPRAALLRGPKRGRHPLPHVAADPA